MVVEPVGPTVTLPLLPEEAMPLLARVAFMEAVVPFLRVTRSLRLLVWIKPM